MLTEEYGLPLEVRSAWSAALITFAAFLTCGLVPLLPFVLDLRNPLALSIAMTGGTLFLIGSVKSRWSMRSWWRSGLSTFLVGAIAAGLAFGVGAFLRMLAR